jgi:Fe-S oxidoreductase/FAD/FMN-containing dehydrogenase
MIGNNSCGVHSVMASWEGDGARTGDFIEQMEVLLYDGTIMTVGRTSEEELNQIISRDDAKGKIYQKLLSLRDEYSSLIRQKFPLIPRRVSGYNIDELLPGKPFNVARALAGSESTCVVVLSATLKLIHHFDFRSLVILGYKDVYSAAEHIEEILKFKPIGLEGVDDKLIEFMKMKNLHTDLLDQLPEGKGWLWIEFGADTKEHAEHLAEQLKLHFTNKQRGPDIKIFLTPEEQHRIWQVRDSGLGATAFIPGWSDTWEGWEDAAVPPEKLSPYLKAFRKLLDKYSYDTTIYGHFGQGCVHCRINFDFTTKEGIENYKSFTGEAADLVVSFGGSLSGEHGDGQSRGELLSKMFGDEIIEAFRKFKSIWDPQWKMNPGKKIDAYPRDSNLRLGEGFTFKKTDTVFKYPEDKGNFGRATMRCVGVGECRKTDKGLMCPSYMVTRDEQHSTRGRAHLLFEMMTRDVLEGNWKNEGVKNALDLCLSCKGCMAECPVKVDVATYKAEFLYHYYDNKIRPLHAYIFGHIDNVARMGSHFPSLFNFFADLPVIGDLVKSISGIAPQRKIPALAKESFKSWYHKRNHNNSGRPVILWADTFNNYFFPDALKAASSLLEKSGYNVIVPEGNFCCGRPLYDFGMLDAAKNKLINITESFKKYITEEIPFVGLEPSCISVFRNEMQNLFPADPMIKKFGGNFYSLAEFIDRNQNAFNFESISRPVIYHGHCHQKALLNNGLDEKLLTSLAGEINVPSTGCCGLAGSFGFQKGEKYSISIKLAERSLYPAIRKTNEETVIIADGFSCREQIMHGTGRTPLHLAEILNQLVK